VSGTARIARAFDWSSTAECPVPMPRSVAAGIITVKAVGVDVIPDDGAANQRLTNTNRSTAALASR
jgi:hypothetical protein